MNKNPTEIDWAQLAAYIDGEGCIRVDEQLATEKVPWIRWQLYVTVANTDIRLINHLRSMFGGYVCISEEKRNPHWKVCYYWSVSALQATRILKGCLPYFVIKREQAEVGLAFRDTIAKPGGGRYIGTSQDIKDLRHSQYEELKALKAKVWEDNKVSDIESQLIN